MAALVVFDLDGTLVDSREDLAASTNDVLAGYGAAPLPVEQVTAMVGDGARALVQRALAASGTAADVDQALARFHEHYARRLTATTRPYPGIDEALRALRRTATLTVLTNKPLAPTIRLLEAFGWTGTFAGVIAGDGGFPRKPHPAGLQSLMSTAGVPATATWMVGDSPADEAVAHAAGVRLCLAGWGFGHLGRNVVLGAGDQLAASPGDLVSIVGESR